MSTVLPNLTVEAKFDFVNWTDISAYVRSGQIIRGVNRFDGVVVLYTAGTASVVLTNNDARFDPTYLSGPYVSGAGSQIMPGVEWRIRTTTDGGHTLWTGFADGWRCDYALNGKDATCTLTGTDVTKMLSISGTSLVEPATLLSGTLISDIIGSFAPKAIDAGLSTVQGGTILETDAWSFMQLVSDSEIGELYVRGDGTIVFRERDAIFKDVRSNTPQATFGDAGAELRYTGISLSNDDTQIKNQITIQNVGGTPQEWDNADSNLIFNQRDFSRTDLIQTTDADAMSYAQYLVSILCGTQQVNGVVSVTGDTRVESLIVNPAFDPTNLNPQVLGRELGDLITVKMRPPGRAASPISRNVYIRGIQHTFSPDSAWETIWTFQDAERMNFFVFNHATLGRFDFNKLSF